MVGKTYYLQFQMSLWEKKQQNIVINIWHITHITYDQTVKQNWPLWEETFTTDFNKHCNMYLQLL